ncbi:hypothetical protein D3C73_1327280 [compost metagenome]
MNHSVKILVEQFLIARIVNHIQPKRGSQDQLKRIFSRYAAVYYLIHFFFIYIVWSVI